MSVNLKRVSIHDGTVSAVGGAIGWSVITRILQFGLSLLGSILVVRWLGPDRWGMLTVLRTTLAFVTAICGLGLGQALLRYLPATRALGDRELALRLIRWAILPQVVAWAAAIVVVWLAGDFITKLSFRDMANLFLFGTTLVIFELAFVAGTNMITAFYDTRGLSLVTVGGAATYIVFVSAALALGYGVAGAVLATGVSNLVMAVILVGRLLKAFRTFPPPSAASAADGVATVTLKTTLRYSIPFAAIAVMNLIVWRQSESILLAHFRTMRESGFWDLAYRLPQQMLEFVPGAIWPLLMAGFSEIYSRDSDKLNRAISVYYKLLFLLIAPISIVGAAVGDRAIVAFYGEEMLPAGPICQAFFLIFSVSFLSTPMSMAFYVLEKPGYSFIQYLVNSIVVIGLDILLIPRYGLTGAMIPMALVIAASPFTNYFLLRRCGVRAAIPWGFLSRVYLAAVPCALLYPARLLVRGKVPVTLAAIAAGLLYLVGLRLFRVLGPEEGELIARSRVPLASTLLSFFRLKGLE